MGVILDNPNDAKELAKMLINIADNCTSNLSVQQYVFTRVEEILGLGTDYSDADIEVFGCRHAVLFTKDGKNLIDGPFLRALSSSDTYLQQSASLGFASLLTVCEGDSGALVQWINGKLSACSSIALPALSAVLRKPAARKLFVESGGVGYVVTFLQKLGTNGNAQTIYELVFILWTVSLDTHDAAKEGTLEDFLRSGVVPCLVELVAAAPSRKVVRMSVGALRNLVLTESDKALTEMFSGNLMKLLDNLVQTNAHKQSGDAEFEADVRSLYDIMNRNFRELSTFDRWKSQVDTGALRSVHYFAATLDREN